MGFRGCRRGGYQPPGGFCSRRGRFHGGCAPHCVVAKSAQLCFRLRRKLRPLPCSSSPHRAGRGGGPFWSCPKRECAAPGGREKGAKRAPVQWPSARDGDRRIGACADLAWPSGTLSPSAIPATTVPWRMVRRASGCKNAFDQLLFPRVPLRYALPWRSWGLYRRADEGIRPYEITAGLPNPVGADALIGPLRRLSSTTG